ncbi:uncharacterized protein LOC113375764 [Ctenocephalides felis]|uniref:uncharacterized protein LOC113375764 n=1 Tax=Ctenocephalides felis TaxID=7515 RepID=UPI000E6E2DCB|nr:uncharacterized protein LOC113375764 [Ctenocephalides felis]
MGKNTIAAKVSLEKCYLDCSKSTKTVKKWFADFNRGHTVTDDAERSERPIEVVTPENIKKVQQNVLENQKVKLPEIADTLKISIERDGHIAQEYLNRKNLCASQTHI